MKKLLLMSLILWLIPVTHFAQQIEPGITITSENYEEYLPQLEKLLIPSYFEHAVPALKNGWVTFPVIEMGVIYPPRGYEKFTKKYAGTCKVGPNNELIGWIAGLPFPNPETGAELAWNAYRKRNVCEDLEFGAIFNLYTKEGNLERTMDAILDSKRFVGRTDIPPIPEMPGNNGVLEGKESIVIRAPFEVRGFAMLRVRYEDVNKPDDVFSYIPSIRRVRRLTGGDCTDPILGSDAIFDDFEAWRQKIDPKMTFKILGTRDFLVPIDYDSKENLPKPFLRRGRMQNDWELRPLYILEININNPDYEYSKRLVYIDREVGTAAIYACDNFDQRGRLCRSNFWTVQGHDPETLQRGWFGSIYKNFISKHHTIIDKYPDWKVWYQPISLKLFTIRGLIKKGR